MQTVLGLDPETLSLGSKNSLEHKTTGMEDEIQLLTEWLEEERHNCTRVKEEYDRLRKECEELRKGVGNSMNTELPEERMSKVQVAFFHNDNHGEEEEQQKTRIEQFDVKHKITAYCLTGTHAYTGCPNSSVSIKKGDTSYKLIFYVVVL